MVAKEKMNIAVIGASADREKFGNKCVRAYVSKGYVVFPVNPKQDIIEELKCYKSILDISEDIDILFHSHCACRQ